ncbi:hypothetical protein [Larkinella rosea]|uniref:Uncharacterized protein n=1 Tax=Larkinella rosea TaxID=2025312 RepID=A0A3P1B9G6_9BACT|nr:hypothetical protein [Larkinella rosea]RRA97750.1 hypothetical protein EHT25_32415 [Larkinella rosea]
MSDRIAFIEQLLHRISALQSENSVFFPSGLLPSYRSNPLLAGYHRPDTNVFFTAITVFTLQQIRARLPVALQEKVDKISQSAMLHYPDFQNKDGLKTYNFYKTPKPGRSSGHFPNGRFLHRIEHFRLPDDADDTAMIYLTSQPSREDLFWLKHKLAQHANLATRQVEDSYPEYINLRAYSTWFGKNMPVEFDASVLCNLLFCIFHYNLPLDEHDFDSLTFIRSVVETGRYFREPFRCSHSYPRTVLIFYHIAGLLAAFRPEPLEPIRPQLIRDGFRLLESGLPVMDQLIVSTSLLQLGEKPPRIAVNRIPESEIRTYSFFIAGMLTASQNPLLNRMAQSRLVRMDWTCEAHSLALLLEYLVYSEPETMS